MPDDRDPWLIWLEQHKAGCRRPLGADARRRRYWALGGIAGSWCVFVESDEGAAWGKYEGAALEGLLAWLRKGDSPREMLLADALERCPRGPAQPRAGGADAGEATEPLTLRQLQDARPDGYNHMVAPLLRGEANRASLGVTGALTLGQVGGASAAATCTACAEGMCQQGGP
eukprot:263478-Chlamydomonas_euryale.AAC.1